MKRNVTEKPIDRRIFEPSTDETGRKVREPAEAMREEGDVRIRSRTAAVRGVPGRCPAGYAAYFAGAD